MSIEKSVVSKVTANGTWEGQYGLLYKYEIEMENGQSGDINSKVEQEDDKFGWKIGSEVDYERKQNGKFVNFKKYNPEFGSSPSVSSTPKTSLKKDNDVQKMIVKQSSLKCAIDLVIADKLDPEDWKKMADSFVEWVYDKESETMPFEAKPPF